MQSTEDNVKELIRPTKVLIVDDEQYARTVIRTLLGLVGITNVHDALTPEQRKALVGYVKAKRARFASREKQSRKSASSQ